MRQSAAWKQDRTEPWHDDGFGAELIGQTRSLSAYARRLTGGGADADDLLQDTMLRCWAARASFVTGSNIAGWTRTVMRNSFLSGRRRARFQADLPADALDRMLSVADSQGLTVDLRDADWALGELDPEQREAVLLAGEGVTMEDAAVRLGIPEGTFKSRVARGRLRLRKLTEDRTTPLLADRRATRERRPARPRPKRDWTGVMIG